MLLNLNPMEYFLRKHSPQIPGGPLTCQSFMEIGLGSSPSLLPIYFSHCPHLRLAPSPWMLVLLWAKAGNVIEIRNSCGEFHYTKEPVYASLPGPILIQPFPPPLPCSQALSILTLCLKEPSPPFFTYSHHNVVCVLWGLPIKFTLVFTFFPWPAPWTGVYFRPNLVFHMLGNSFWHQITFLCFLIVMSPPVCLLPHLASLLRTCGPSVILVARAC